MGLFVILSIVGLTLILLGANYLTDGAVALAKNNRLSKNLSTRPSIRQPTPLAVNWGNSW